MGRRSAGRVAAIAAMAAGLALAGCSKSPTPATHPPSTSPLPRSPGARASAAGPAPVPGVTGTDVASQIQAMIDQAESAGSAPFKADYSITINGKPEALTLEEKGANELVSSEGIGEFISSPSNNAFCLTTANPVCYAEGTSSNPLSGLVAFAEPKSVLNVIQGDVGQSSGSSPAYTVTMGTQSHSGSQDTCATVQGNTGKKTTTVYCFNAAGVVAYESTASATLTLTGYSTDVPDSDFDLPASPRPIAG
ncbi:MAG: hypothetical protein ACRDJU_08430 [Actinomycetota bacterium]